jgi:hypothetical protein
LLSWRSNAIALRKLLDDTRTKINDKQPLKEADKSEWNARIDGMSEAELAKLSLSRKQLALTKYGAGKLQELGNTAANAFSFAEIAEAVMSEPELGERISVDCSPLPTAWTPSPSFSEKNSFLLKP